MVCVVLPGITVLFIAAVSDFVMFLRRVQDAGRAGGTKDETRRRDATGW